MCLRDQIFRVLLEHFISANVWRFLVYYWFCAKIVAETIAIFPLVYLCANDCESSDDFAGNCIREWDVWRPTSFCVLFFH